jgi:hypothetical protein
MNDSQKSIMSRPIPVNPTLVWDYEIPLQKAQTEGFRRWYISRVLTRGSSEDLQTIGLNTIYVYLPGLNLPKTIQRFWEWYFNLPDVKPRYESADSFSTNDRYSNQ